MRLARRTATRVAVPDPKFAALLSSMVGGDISQAFRRMGIAEEEILSGRRRYPNTWKRDVDAKGRAVFHALCPRNNLEKLSTDVYRFHAREMCDRFGRGENLEPGTKAEVMALLSFASLKAPPDATTAALYGRIFAECFPLRSRELGDVGRELYSGACDELFAKLQRQITVNGRGVPKT